MEVQAVPRYVGFAGDTVVKFPKYVVFKGDNDNYLAAYLDYREYLKFSTDDIGSGLVRHEVVEVGDGIVMLKCLHWNKFWRRSPNWIWADTANFNSSDNDMLFQPIKVDDQRVALRSLGNNAFCKRFTNAEQSHCLSAATSTLETTAIFRVGEPTLSRRVHSIEYQMDTALIYDLEPVSVYRVTVTNPADILSNLQVAYSYMEKKSTSWKRGVSFTTGVKTTFETGIPLVVEGKVELSASGTVSGEWGGSEEKQSTVTGTYTVPVNGGGMVEVTVWAVHAKCDVKFSYTQEDLFTTGERVVTAHVDGVFSGVNTTDIKFEARSI